MNANVILSLMIKKLRSRGHFNICPVRDALDALEIQGFRETPEYKLLTMAHCTDYASLDQAEIDAIEDAIKSLLGIENRLYIALTPVN